MTSRLGIHASFSIVKIGMSRKNSNIVNEKFLKKPALIKISAQLLHTLKNNRMMRNNHIAVIINCLHHHFLGDIQANQQLSQMVRGEMFVLNYLFTHEGAIHPKELSRQMAVTTARIASLLNHMEQKQLLPTGGTDGFFICKMRKEQ